MLADLRYFDVSPEPVRSGAALRYSERVQALAERRSLELVAHA